MAGLPISRRELDRWTHAPALFDALIARNVDRAHTAHRRGGLAPIAPFLSQPSFTTCEPFAQFIRRLPVGREECIEEMLSFTQEKNIHVRLKPAIG